MSEVKGNHVGADVRMFYWGSTDRLGTVERPHSSRKTSAGQPLFKSAHKLQGYRGGTVIPVEPRNGLPVPARYEWRRGGRITALTARILAEIGPGEASE